jgi:hypothetical protein
VSGLYSLPGPSGGGKEVCRRGWVELPALEGLRRLYAGAWLGIVMEGRFFGRDSCGPVGGGEVALPGGLLAMFCCSFCDAGDTGGRLCSGLVERWVIRVNFQSWDGACSASDGERRCDRLQPTLMHSTTETDPTRLSC